MSAATPTHVMQAVWNNARGMGQGAVVTGKEARTYMKDLGGWFFFWGDMVDMRAESMGAGMYLLKGTKR